MKRQLMLRAWEIARKLVGDLRTRLSQALKQAWAELRQSELSELDIKSLVHETLEENYSRLLSYSYEKESYTELTTKSIEYKRGRRIETVISRIKMHSNGKIDILYDRTKKVSEILKNVKVFGIKTKEQRKIDATNNLVNYINSSAF